MKCSQRHSLAVSGRLASAGREVQSPLWLESPADPDCSALQQGISYSLQCPERLLIDALTGDDHQPPAQLVEFLTPEDVGQPLSRVLGLLAAAVFDDQPEVLVREVATSVPAAVMSANDQIHARLRKTGQYQKQPKPGLLW